MAAWRQSGADVAHRKRERHGIVLKRTARGALLFGMCRRCAAITSSYHAKQLNDDALLNKLLPKLLGSETPESLKDTIEIRDIIKATFVGYIGNRVSGFIYK